MLATKSLPSEIGSLRPDSERTNAPLMKSLYIFRTARRGCSLFDTEPTYDARGGAPWVETRRMPSMRVVIAEPFADTGQAVLHEHGIDVVSCVGRPREDLLAALHDADGLIVRSETRVDRDLLSHAPRIRVVGRAGVGVDAIDVDAATEAGIVVVNTPAANTIAATEHTFAMMLALLRNVATANASIRDGRWERTPFIGSELYGKTLGIVGLGRIGG